MRATGIVRRIDELGRVAIPKDIRKILHIKEGDPFELFTIEDGVCFRKYHIDDSIVSRMKNIAEELDHVYGKFTYARQVYEIAKEIEGLI